MGRVTRLPRAAIALAAVCCCALLWPAIGAAKSASYDLIVGPLHDHGYVADATLIPEGTGHYDLGFSFTDIKGHQSQSYSFNDEKFVKMKVSSNLSSATVSTSFGTRGSVGWKFKASSGLKVVAVNDGHNVLGCKLPKRTTREGRVDGSFSFKTDTVFGTLKGKNVKAVLAKVPTTGSCKSSNLTALNLPGTTAGFESNELLASTYGKYTSVTASYLSFGSGADPFSIDASIAQWTPKSVFTHSGLSSAKAKVSGSFMSGSVSYKSTGNCGKDATHGTVSGTIKAHFLVGGTQVYPSSGSATMTENIGYCGV